MRHDVSVRNGLAAVAFFAALAGGGCTPTATLVTYDPNSAGFVGDSIIDDPTAMSQQLHLLQTATPHQDADIALGAGDQRFLAVKEYSVYLPGIKGQDNTDAIIQQYGIRIIAGTSTDHPELLQPAIRYAEAYNDYLVRKLKPFSQTAVPGRF